VGLVVAAAVCDLVQPASDECTRLLQMAEFRQTHGTKRCAVKTSQADGFFDGV
jgi:hypothetical protein